MGEWQIGAGWDANRKILCGATRHYGYSGRVQVRVLTFGVLREMFGGSVLPVELPEGATAGELLRILRGRTSNAGMGFEADAAIGEGAEERLWQSLAVAVNREYCTRGAVLHDGDEVALLPPVSGGWCCAHGCYALGERLAALADGFGRAEGECHAD